MPRKYTKRNRFNMKDLKKYYTVNRLYMKPYVGAHMNREWIEDLRAAVSMNGHFGGTRGFYKSLRRAAHKSSASV